MRKDILKFLLVFLTVLFVGLILIIQNFYPRKYSDDYYKTKQIGGLFIFQNGASYASFDKKNQKRLLDKFYVSNNNYYFVDGLLSELKGDTSDQLIHTNNSMYVFGDAINNFYLSSNNAFIGYNYSNNIDKFSEDDKKILPSITFNTNEWVGRLLLPKDDLSDWSLYKIPNQNDQKVKLYYYSDNGKYYFQFDTGFLFMVNNDKYDSLFTIDTGLDSSKLFFIKLGNSFFKLEPSVTKKPLGVFMSSDLDNLLYFNGDKWKEELFDGSDKKVVVSDCSGESGGALVEVEKIKREDNDFAIKLSAKNHQACFKERFFIDLKDRGESFFVMFDYKHVDGDFATSHVLLSDTGSYDKHVFNFLDYSWNNYGTLIKTNKETEYIDIYFYSKYIDRETINYYDNLQIVKVSDGEKLNLSLQEKFNTDMLGIASGLVFNTDNNIKILRANDDLIDINSTVDMFYLIKNFKQKDAPVGNIKYDVTKSGYLVRLDSINDSFSLINSDIFNDDLRAYYIDSANNKHLIATHFLINDYANAWAIDYGDLEKRDLCRSGSPCNITISVENMAINRFYYILFIFLVILLIVFGCGVVKCLKK